MEGEKIVFTQVGVQIFVDLVMKVLVFNKGVNAIIAENGLAKSAFQKSYGNICRIVIISQQNALPN